MGKASTQTSRSKVEAMASAILDEKYKADKPQMLEALVENIVFLEGPPGSRKAYWAAGVEPVDVRNRLKPTTVVSKGSPGTSQKALAPAAMAIVEEAIRVFGERKLAESWLNHPRQQFAGKSPSQMLTTAPGRKAVSELLNQIDHGIFS